MSSDDQALLVVTCAGQAGSDGLRSYRFNAQQGTLEQVSMTGQGITHPLHVAADRAGLYLYVADHVQQVNDQDGGAVAAFEIDRPSGGLKFINRQSSHGLVPCYVSVTADGGHALVANYTDGNVAMLPIDANGALEPASDVKEHGRVDGDQARAHCILPDPSGRFALATDLGVDRIFSYRIDRQAGRLQRNDPPGVATAAGAGPRHLVFAPDGRMLYAMTEYDNTVIAMAYQPDAGGLAFVQIASALPADYTHKSHGSDIGIHPSGRWLYAANRGHDSMAIFAIEGQTGRLTLQGHTPTQGSFPRSFTLDRTGAFLLVGNEKSNAIRIFAVDAQTGQLKPTDAVIDVPAPTGMAFV